MAGDLSTEISPQESPRMIHYRGFREPPRGKDRLQIRNSWSKWDAPSPSRSSYNPEHAQVSARALDERVKPQRGAPRGGRETGSLEVIGVVTAATGCTFSSLAFAM
jgi:hypothetical protein